ncbi:MAG TPA: (d)CMP kinase [Thermodesulfobacteriaceae bacterium]|nr:(d)CMP kinase [Thermodesulfobacteriaceae bacterium]
MRIITIDGPAGAGKSTVSKRLARLLNYTYLDTGAMYRAVAWAAKNSGISVEDDIGISELLENLELDIRDDTIIVNRRDISSLIRTPEMDRLSSAVSRLPAVRKYLTEMQKKIGNKGDIVAEGRDMGSVVFPNAEYKFFLTTSPEERARRRMKQIEEQGEKVSYEAILKQIIERDHADSSRSIAPLKVPEDCTVIDSTNLSVDNVLEKILIKIKK